MALMSVDAFRHTTRSQAATSSPLVKTWVSNEAADRPGDLKKPRGKRPKRLNIGR